MHYWLEKNFPLLLLLITQLFVIIYTYKKILITNQNHFVYTLDDPYIFLAMAKNHFLGVTESVYANPSSSLLGVYVLGAFHSFFDTLFPLYLNVICSLLTTIIFWRTLEYCFPNEKHQGYFIQQIVKFGSVILLVLSTNQLALIFSGMEHTIEVMLCAIIVYGIFYEYKYKKFPFWFMATLIILPLWRYDLLAVFVPMLIYVFFRGYVLTALVSFIVSLLFILIYFIGWHHLTGFYFPSSLIVRSPEIRKLQLFLETIKMNGWELQAAIVAMLLLTSVFLYCIKDFLIKNKVIIMYGFIFLLFLILFRSPNLKIIFSYYPDTKGLAIILLLLYFRTKDEKKIFIGTTLLILLLHLNFTTVNKQIYRYSAYISLFMVFPILIYIQYFLSLSRFTQREKIVCITPFLFLIIFFVFDNDFISTQSCIDESSSIYRQQYQIALFLKNNYRKPVAVNDLGLIAYYNPGKTIDVCGLGYTPILNEKELSNNLFCYPKNIPSSLIQREKIELIIIYDSWFAKIPGGFVRVAELITAPPLGYLGTAKVSFYVRPSNYQSTLLLLKKFKSTLPQGVSLNLISNPAST